LNDRKNIDKNGNESLFMYSFWSWTLKELYPINSSSSATAVLEVDPKQEVVVIKTITFSVQQ